MRVRVGVRGRKGGRVTEIESETGSGREREIERVRERGYTERMWLELVFRCLQRTFHEVHCKVA